MKDGNNTEIEEEYILRYIDVSEELRMEMVGIRHDLHKNPEVSWQEYETTSYLHRYISQLDGIEWVDMGLETGCVALLKGGHAGKTVALRADIDALHGEETYCSDCMSRVPHVAHLCGHDMHMASLCGAARMLSAHRSDLHGNVLLIFQPAEETTNGAQCLIDRGLYEKVPFDAVFGLHNRPECETGRIIVKQGGLMAAKINFKISIYGVGGHGSMPHKCVDPIVCAAGIVQNVLTIPSRNVDPMESIVLSICSIHGGTPDNLIVDEVEMTGSMRYLDRATGERALERLRTVVSSTAETFECRWSFEIVDRIDAVDNSASLYEIARSAAVDAVGVDNIESTRGCLATEDFSAYMKCAPGFFYWLGNRKRGDDVYSWHHTKFHADDEALVYGARVLAASVWRFLGVA